MWHRCSNSRQVGQFVRRADVKGRKVAKLCTESSDCSWNLELENAADERSVIEKLKVDGVLRFMEVDMPFHVVFEDGESLAIDVGMEPEIFLSMDEPPPDAAMPEWGISATELFANFVGRNVADIEVRTALFDTHPTQLVTFAPPRRLFCELAMLFDGGEELVVSPWYDFLHVAAKGADGKELRAKWEDVRGGYRSQWLTHDEIMSL